MAKNDSSSKVRAFAAGHLKDHVALTEIIETDDASGVTNAAARALEALAASGSAPAAKALRAAHFVIMLTGHFQGCKLMASFDSSSHEACALDVQFKDAAPSAGVVAAALAAWRPVLASNSLVVPDALVATGWRSRKPQFATYTVMSLEVAGHGLDTRCDEALRYETIEPQ